MANVYYSELWADLKVGDIVTVKGSTYTIGTDAFNDYGEAAATGETVLDLDTYYSSAWTAGESVTVYARGGSYTATVSATASGTTNAFTTQAIAKSAHTSYYADGGVVINGATVTKREFLGATQLMPYILKNYIGTGGSDQGVCLFALSTAKNEGGYTVVGAGSTINTAYMGHRNSGSTKGTLKLEVVDGAKISTLYTAGLYDSYVGDSTETYEGGFSTTVEVDIVNATVSTTYVGNAYTGRRLFANVTINADHASGASIYGGGASAACASNGGLTVNLTDSNYTGWIGYYNPEKGSSCCVDGTLAVNAVAGTSTVAKGFALRNTDTITINANALLIAGGAYTTTAKSTDFSGTITIDATDYLYGSVEEKLVYRQTDTDITANLVLLGDTTKYALKQSGKNLYVVARPIVYSMLWKDMTAGETVVVAGSTYTIGTDAFGDYNDAAAAATTLERPVSIVDAYYSADWSGKTTGDKVTVTIDGTDVELTIGKNAFTTTSAAAGAAGTTGTFVIYGGTKTMYGGERYDYFTQNGQTWTFRQHIEYGSPDNGGYVTGTYSGTVIVTDKSSLTKINGYGCGERTGQDLTIIVDDAYVGNLLGGHYTTTDTYTVDATTGAILWDGTAAHSTTYLKVVNGGTVGGIYGGCWSYSSQSGDVVVTLDNARVVGEITGTMDTSVTGNLTCTVTGSTIGSINGGSNSGSRYMGFSFVGGTSYVGSFGSDWDYTTGLSITVNAGDRAALVIGTSYNMPAMATITIDVTGFEFGAGEDSYTVIASNSYITGHTITTTGAALSEFDVSVENGNVMLTKKKCYYTAAWADLADGTIVTIVGGGTATIGFDAFGNYNDALAGAAELGRDITNYDVYYSSDWSSKGSGDTVYVVLDGNTVSQTIGDKAFTKLDTAQKAMTTAGAVVFEGGSYTGNDGGSFTLGGYRTVLSGGTYSGITFGGVASGTCNTIDVTANTAWISTLNPNRYVSCNGTINFHVSDSVVGDIRFSSYSQDDCISTVLVENSSIGCIMAGYGGNKGTSNITLVGSTITGLVGGAGLNDSSHNNGNVNFTITDVTSVRGTKQNYGFSAARGTDGNQWKSSCVKGDVTVTVNGTASNFLYFDVKQYVANSMTVTIDADTTLTATEFYATSGQTITIDVDGFTFGESEISHTVISAGNGGLTGYNFVTSGTAATDYELSVTSKAVTLNKKLCYFSSAWVGLEDGTVVTTPSGTATIGTNAFVSYADAKSAADTHNWYLQTPDRFYSYEWKDLGEGDEVTIVNASGTFTTTIGDSAIPAYTTLSAAKTAAQTANTTLAMVGGTYTLSGRNQWKNIANTIMTNSRITGSANGGLVTMLDGGGTFTSYEAAFTVGENAYLSSIGVVGNDAGCVVKEITYNVNDGGRIGVLYLIGFGGFYVGDLTVNMDGGTVDTIYTTLVGGTVNGDFNVSMKDAKIGSFYLAPESSSTSTLADGASINFTLDNSTMTITDFDKDHTLTKGEGATVNVAVEGTATSTINFATANVDTVTIDVGATLAINSNWKYTGTITVDAADCDYSKAQYLLVSGKAITNTIEVVNDDPTQNYKIVQVGTNVFYQAATTYFSVTWQGLAAGTKVTVAGEEYTIGTDAFASYDLAVAAGAKLISSADTYLNSSYNATDPIEIGNYTATFGVDAFADQASAVATAKTMGGALDVTGWTAALTGLDGIENVYISNADIGSGASISIQTGTATEAATLNVSIADSNANYVNIVNKGSVTGDVNVTATDVTTHNAFYVVSAGNSVGGNVNVTIAGKSYLTKGLYTLDDNATVGGDLTITVAGGEIYRKGIVNFGTVDGTSSVTVTGDATISSIMDCFDTVTINEGVTLNYGIGLEGDWKNSYLYGFRNLVNNGTLNYNAELGQNTYAMLYETLSGTGTIDLGDNVEFVEGGTTYVAELQEQVLVNSDWSGKEVFDVIDVDGGTVIYGVSAFATKETAQTSGLTSDATTFIEYGKVIEGAAHGEDGHLGIAGGTVTGTAFAGEAITEAGGTITQSSELVAMSTSDAAGDYASLIGGYDIQEYADTTIAANSSLVVGGAGDLTGKALVGGSYITASAVDWIGTSNVSMTSGSFSNALIGGALVNGENASISGTLATDVTVSGGTVKVLGGGCYLQNGGSIDVSGTSNITLTNCTVVGSVFGGNYANKLSVSTKDTSLWNGNTSITIDATQSVVIGGNLVAGSYGTGKVSGNTTITLTGSGDNLSIGGIITGDCSGGNDSASGKFVTGTRTLNFTNFSGSLGTATKKVTGFDAVALSGSTVSLAGYGMLRSVSDWQITDSTLDWTKGANDFSGDQLTLTYSGELNDEWTVFQLTDKLTTGWDEFTTDGSGTAKIILSINGEGTIAEFDDTENAYLGTISDVNYKFYLDTENNALKVAKLA